MCFYSSSYIHMYCIFTRYINVMYNVASLELGSNFLCPQGAVKPYYVNAHITMGMAVVLSLAI